MVSAEADLLLEQERQRASRAEHLALELSHKAERALRLLDGVATAGEDQERTENAREQLRALVQEARVGICRCEACITRREAERAQKRARGWTPRVVPGGGGR